MAKSDTAAEVGTRRNPAELVPFLLQLGIFAVLLPFAFIVLPLSFLALQRSVSDAARPHFVGMTGALGTFSAGILLCFFW